MRYTFDPLNFGIKTTFLNFYSARRSCDRRCLEENPRSRERLVELDMRGIPKDQSSGAISLEIGCDSRQDDQPAMH